MRDYRKNFYGRRTYEETPHFYISDMRAWPDKVLIIKGHAVDEGQHYVPESEVTKLRELCTDLYEYFEMEADPLDGVYDEMRGRIYELGIEV